MNITHKGIARCKIIEQSLDQGSGLIADFLEGCTWKMCPYGLSIPTPDPTAPECLVEFSTDGDRLVELEAYAGILYVFEYGEI